MFVLCIIVISISSRYDEDNVVHATTSRLGASKNMKNIVSANVPMECQKKNGRLTVAQQVVTLRDRSRTTRKYACHLIDRYYGPYSNCNLNYKNSFYIPVVFHNLLDAFYNWKSWYICVYDGHVDLLSITKEKYISFTKHIQDIAERAD